MTAAIAHNTHVTLPEGHRMRARWYRPARNNGLNAAVIVIHDIFGFTDDQARIAERLADNGYPVLAPDLYDRPGVRALCMARTLRDHERGHGAAFEHLEACRRWVLEQDEEPVRSVAMMGFCMGGRFALLFAARGGLRVVAPFYGGVPRSAGALTGICPVVGGWGKKDLIYGGHGERLERHLTDLGVPHDVKTYPDAGHSYMNDHQTFYFKKLADYSPLRARYQPDAAEDSWQRVLAFFKNTLSEQLSA
ncbi:dienelactone hydrolase family protein [Alloalcanivorax gelatiniphagus]|uniref:Dienelactone hydrolase family protein n=1 Tax=Alloalcanivorax gelatiniphagus TaxID=1194167 RepID=A0ABY2XHB0_9GAMM|nr:dienelactone hydrolase family protein [Alloalcanivorax gelatiniphagus]TMW10387.1 dienelactone hydrolase family protein [Alloalcanivorax gelatiniphagus]|tara:strand:- start:22741 stop:23487 length:747 start_codon:yes stop_codon:yes gene_type:complete